MKIGIIAAEQEEFEAILNIAKVEERKEIYELNFVKCKIKDKICVLVKSGVGKVNAARATQILIDNFKPDYKTIKGKKSVIDELKKEHGEVKLTSIGSSIKICLVAEGTADIYPRFAPTMEWDTAAGHAIAKAAGKELYHQDGCTPLAYNKEDLLNPWFIVK